MFLFVDLLYSELSCSWSDSVSSVYGSGILFRKLHGGSPHSITWKPNRRLVNPGHVGLRLVLKFEVWLIYILISTSLCCFYECIC